MKEERKGAQPVVVMGQGSFGKSFTREPYAGRVRCQRIVCSMGRCRLSCHFTFQDCGWGSVVLFVLQTPSRTEGGVEGLEIRPASWSKGIRWLAVVPRPVPVLQPRAAKGGRMKRGIAYRLLLHCRYITFLFLCLCLFFLGNTSFLIVKLIEHKLYTHAAADSLTMAIRYHYSHTSN